MWGYSSLKDVLETFGSFVLPGFIWFYQENKIDKSMFLYENTSVDNIMETKDYSEFKFKLQYDKNSLTLWKYIDSLDIYKAFVAADVISVKCRLDNKLWFLIKNKSFTMKKFLKKYIKNQKEFKLYRIQHNQDKTLYTLVSDYISIRITNTGFFLNEELKINN